MSNDDQTPDEKQKGMLAEILTAGFTFPICVLVGYFVGSWVDRRFGIAPFGLLGGVLLGLGAALVPVFRLSNSWEKIEQARRASNPKADRRLPPDEAPPPDNKTER